MGRAIRPSIEALRLRYRRPIAWQDPDVHGTSEHSFRRITWRKGNLNLSIQGSASGWRFWHTFATRERDRMAAKDHDYGQCQFLTRPLRTLCSLCCDTFSSASEQHRATKAVSLGVSHFTCRTSRHNARCEVQRASSRNSVSTRWTETGCLDKSVSVYLSPLQGKPVGPLGQRSLHHQPTFRSGWSTASGLGR